MSGQPYRYAKDIENFRDNYMEALGLRANLDDMNLQANKIYKETGTIPPKSTAMKDTRTTAEILMDTEKLKIGLIGELKSVCSPQMALLVVQRVISSPLNADGSFLVWFSQNASELVINLKKKYKFGIAGNDNDAEQMVLFLQNIFSKTKDMSSSVKTAFDRPAGSGTLGVEVGDFVTLKKQFDEIYLRLISKGDRYTQQILQDIKGRLDGLNNVINNPPNRYKLVSDKFNELSTGSYSASHQSDINALGFSDWLEYTDKIPSSVSLRTLIDQLTKSNRNNNPELSNSILLNIISLLPTKLISDNVYIITNKILQATRATTLTQNPVDTIDASLIQPATSTKITPAHKMLLNDLATVTTEMINDVTYNQAMSPDPQTANDLLEQTILREIPQIENYITTRKGVNWIVYTKYDREILIRAIRDMTHVFDFEYSKNEDFSSDLLKKYIRKVSGSSGSMLGAGLKKRVGRPKGSGLVKPLSERIDRTKGVSQGNTHVPFGKYIINKNKLENDIVSFKHNKGYRIAGYPMKKVSSNFGGVMRTIAGGGIPKFEDFNRLSEEEKDYLHKVSEKAGILDKLSIPQPSKDKLEQDIHEFEVMKGEILAGNDSPEVIKKFKLILLKLTKTGTIPKREGMEMMEELLSLGF